MMCANLVIHHFHTIKGKSSCVISAFQWINPEANSAYPPQLRAVDPSARYVVHQKIMRRFRELVHEGLNVSRGRSCAISLKFLKFGEALHPQTTIFFL